MAAMRHPNLIATVIVTALVGAPILATAYGALAGSETQAHIWSTNGARYLFTTVGLCAGVAVLSGAIGAVTALVVSLTEFPGRRILDLALALPFAIPAYVAAYAYGDFLGPFGAAAGVFGPAALPEIRSLGGAVFILSLATYPYVYLAMRASLAARSAAFLEASRSLGQSPFAAARKVLLALSMPALIGGLALALMETAADYGVADYYGVPTLSVGIFRTWYGMGDLGAATQLALALFLIAALLVLIENVGARGRVAESVRAQRDGQRLRLSPGSAALCIGFCSIPIILGFVIPVYVFASQVSDASTLRGLAQAGINTGLVASVGAAGCVVIAVFLSYAARSSKSRFIAMAIRLATLGYAIPGAVIAIGILMLADFTGASVAAAGIFLLLYAYVVRFLTASFNITQSGLSQISARMDDAARMLGASSSAIVTRLHYPLTRTSILAGAAIVAIDIAKELPATLLLRPFNFETLSTHIYRLASDERLADASVPALLLITFSLAPAIGLTLATAQKETRNRQEPIAG